MNTGEFRGFYVERAHPRISTARYCLHVYAPDIETAKHISLLHAATGRLWALRVPEED